MHHPRTLDYRLAASGPTRNLHELHQRTGHPVEALALTAALLVPSHTCSRNSLSAPLILAPTRTDCNNLIYRVSLLFTTLHVPKPFLSGRSNAAASNCCNTWSSSLPGGGGRHYCVGVFLPTNMHMTRSAGPSQRRCLQLIRSGLMQNVTEHAQVTRTRAGAGLIQDVEHAPTPGT